MFTKRGVTVFHVASIFSHAIGGVRFKNPGEVQKVRILFPTWPQGGMAKQIETAWWWIGTMEFYGFSFSSECHHPNISQLTFTHILQRGGEKPPTRKAKILNSDFHCFSIWKRGRGSDCTALAPSPQVCRGFFMLFPGPSPDSAVSMSFLYWQKEGRKEHAEHGGESNFCRSSSLGYRWGDQQVKGGMSSGDTV